MPQTPRFSWNTWAANQAQPNQTFNNLLLPIDQLVGLSVISRTTAAQPGSPNNGDAYILPASPTGAAWGSFSENQVAYYWDDGTTASWYALTPPTGLMAFVQDLGGGGEGGPLIFDGSVWTAPWRAKRYETGTSYELVLGDQIIELNNAGAISLAIPDNSATPFPRGTEILVIQGGGGTVTASVTSDTLVGTTATSGTNSVLHLVKVGTTKWLGF